MSGNSFPHRSSLRLLCSMALDIVSWHFSHNQLLKVRVKVQSVVGVNPILSPCYCQAIVGLLIWDTLSIKRMGLQFTAAISDSSLPQHWEPDSHIYISQEQGGPVTSLALSSLFISYYNSQGYGGAILMPRRVEHYSLRADLRENTASNSSSILVCLTTFLMHRKHRSCLLCMAWPIPYLCHCLLCHNLVMDITSD
jgi:hypothetical protein